MRTGLPKNIQKIYLDNAGLMLTFLTFLVKIVIFIKLKFMSKIQILVKDRNFGQKSKFWSKIETLVKHQNFGQKHRNS